MKQGNRGFTLIEMMVAIAIGAILMGVAIPNFTQMREGYRLRSATYDVFAALQRARAEAVKRNNNYRFSLVDATTYKLHNDSNSNGVENAGETTTQKNVAVESPGVEMYFYCWAWDGAGWSWVTSLNFAPDGTTGRGSQSWVGLVNSSNGEWRWIQITPGGRIHVY
jgi:prepilin-type N-terminal cleavage/methylation domain-containing protein